jgi:hypothetical protein
LTGVIIGVETAYLLAIVLSVLLIYTDSDYPFGIFELFFSPAFTGLGYMSNTVRMSYKKQELLTLHEHLGTLVGSVLIIISVASATDLCPEHPYTGHKS